jgi:hydrogenase large subunit
MISVQADLQSIEGRNATLIMKSGVYDGATDAHKLMDQFGMRS